MVFTMDGGRDISEVSWLHASPAAANTAHTEKVISRLMLSPLLQLRAVWSVFPRVIDTKIIFEAGSDKPRAVSRPRNSRICFEMPAVGSDEKFLRRGMKYFILDIY
jgi:hypothetical protein